MTLVGVFCFANVLSWDTSFFVQLFPVFLVYLGIVCLPVNSNQLNFKQPSLSSIAFLVFARQRPEFFT